MKQVLGLVALLLVVTGCGPATDTAAGQPEGDGFRITGRLESARLDEASGLQAGTDGLFFSHNDDGVGLFITDGTGRDLGTVEVRGAKDRDWEDITRVPGEDGPLLVIGDIGDNEAVRKSVSLYFLPEPVPGDGGVEAVHRVRLRYPDGPRDAEAMAWDPVSGMILLMSKRDHPPRLYGVPLRRALAEKEMEAEYLGEVPGLRPPSKRDLLLHPKSGRWVSQPTGMDISADGRTAAVITYRSLYLFRREGEESWAEAFRRVPQEFIGPPAVQEEAVAFGDGGTAVYVTTEGRPAPLYRLELPSRAEPREPPAASETPVRR